MKDLVILSLDVHIAEIADIVDRVNRVEPTWRLLGWVAPESKKQRIGEMLWNRPIMGMADVLEKHPDVHVLPNHNWRDAIPLPPDRIATLIDPSAFVAASATIGRGCLIYPHCFMGHNAVLEDRVFVLSGCVINHDDHLEQRVTLASAVTLAGSVHVEPGCYLGQSCTVREKLRIGKDSLLGMGSVIVRDVPANSVMVGNPARRLRHRYERIET